MAGYNQGSNSNSERSSDLQRIFLHARNTNLLWRYQILEENGLDPTNSDYINKMEEDIFWDLSEINMEDKTTKSLRITNMNLNTLPETMEVPVRTSILDLSGNKFDSIPKSWYENFDNLKILRIARNHFQLLNWDGLGYLEQLRMLDLRDNPWDETFMSKFKSYVKLFLPNIQKIYF